jgi:hypothetical protein
MCHDEFQNLHRQRNQDGNFEEFRTLSIRIRVLLFGYTDAKALHRMVSVVEA